MIPNYVALASAGIARDFIRDYFELDRAQTAKLERLIDGVIDALDLRETLSEATFGARCSQGHVNSPYPEDGRCTECGYWLPGTRR